MPDTALGFSAIQLSREAEPLNPNEWSLERLQAAGKLTNAPPAIELFPEDQRAREVLGYLHANCGHCHQPRSSVSSRVSLSLWLRTDQLGSVEQTPMYLSTVGKPVNLSLVAQGEELLQIVAPGSSQDSALFARASSRGEAYSMPPLSTKEADPVITELLRQWIESLDDPPPPADDEADDEDAEGSEDGSEGDGSEDGSGDDGSGDGSEDDSSEDDSSEDDGE
jgi:hypothetical protein